MSCENCGSSDTEQMPPLRDDRMVPATPTQQYRCRSCGHITRVRGS